jgi:hypothetical protein
MKRLADWRIEHNGVIRKIELLQGDLTEIPTQHAVDVLVVSAFPNDYTPTPGSLIGALAVKGIPVAQLARFKEVDLRRESSCWLSQPTALGDRLVRILCIESGWRGTPPEITDDLFRALAPTSIFHFPNAVVAMPLIGAGDQGWPPEQMLETIVRSAISWFKRGLSLRALKIVVRSPVIAEKARVAFNSLRQEAASKAKRLTDAPRNGHDVFLSYSHVDAAVARIAFNALLDTNPNIRVFYDRKALTPGASWLMEIAESLDTAQRVVALSTPAYWHSQYCRDEFIAAFTRQHDTGAKVLFPVYFKTAKIPYMFRTIQHEDCREADVDKVSAVCRLYARRPDA